VQTGPRAGPWRQPRRGWILVPAVLPAARRRGSAVRQVEHLETPYANCTTTLRCTTHQVDTSCPTADRQPRTSPPPPQADPTPPLTPPDRPNRFSPRVKGSPLACERRTRKSSGYPALLSDVDGPMLGERGIPGRTGGSEQVPGTADTPRPVPTHHCLSQPTTSCAGSPRSCAGSPRSCAGSPLSPPHAAQLPNPTGPGRAPGISTGRAPRDTVRRSRLHAQVHYPQTPHRPTPPVELSTTPPLLSPTCRQSNHSNRSRRSSRNRSRRRPHLRRRSGYPLLWWVLCSYNQWRTHHASGYPAVVAQEWMATWRLPCGSRLVQPTPRLDAAGRGQVPVVGGVRSAVRSI
jgi:hypothetical protein